MTLLRNYYWEWGSELKFCTKQISTPSMFVEI